MDKETLDLFISKAKLLKCNYVRVMSNYIVGTDEYFSHVSIVSHSEPKFWAFKDKTFDTKQFTLVKDLKEEFEYLIKSVNKLLEIPITESFLSLHENTKFKEIMAKKADDGISMFRLNEDYLISVNKSLIPLNKSDKLDLFIRDNYNGTFSGEFIIKKGKDVEIKKYFLYLRL